MKMIKMALLGGAALAVTSAGAYADDLSALKAEIEALNARVAQLEATPSVPAGYQLMTITEGANSNPSAYQFDPGYAKTATIIGVMPTADAPAATTIEWSGYARTNTGRVDWYGGKIKDEDGNVILDTDKLDDTYINVRGQLKVVGKTDTSVGEVGAVLQLRAEEFFSVQQTGATEFYNVGKSTWKANEAWGWWAMTPELVLGGGYTGSVSDVGFGMDAACNCYGTDNGGIYIGTGDAEQLRLTWSSGPMTIAAAIQDDQGPNGDDLAVAARAKYAGDSFSAGIAGFYDGNGNNKGANNTQDEYEVTIGVGFGLDMFALSAMAGIGQERDGSDYWIASAIASVNLNDEWHAEIGYGYQGYDQKWANDQSDLIAGIYYDPVPQLTIGAEGEWADGDSKTNQFWVANLVTVFRF